MYEEFPDHLPPSPTMTTNYGHGVRAIEIRPFLFQYTPLVSWATTVEIVIIISTRGHATPILFFLFSAKPPGGIVET